MINTSYRKNYIGEFVVYKTLLEDGKYQETREWIPSKLQNTNHAGTAVVLGNGLSRNICRLDLLSRHKMQRPELRLQTYGCNAVFRDFDPDFLVVTDDTIASELSSVEHLSALAFSTPEIMMNHANKFHLIPNGVRMNAGAVATYLACFDGHKRIYLLGFDNQTSSAKLNNIYAGTDELSDHSGWDRNMFMIFRAYPDTEFIRVSSVGPTPASWSRCLNYRQISYRQFVVEVDL